MTNVRTMVTVRPFLLALLILSVTLVPRTDAFFRDVSKAAGLRYDGGAKSKYGGASVGDLDGDGCPDLLLGHHATMEIYFNQCNGRFKKADFKRNLDIHALSPVRLRSTDRQLHFILSRGGGRGAFPKGSLAYRILPNRTIVDVTNRLGLKNVFQRGRTAVTLDMQNPNRPARRQGNRYADILLTSADMKNRFVDNAAFQTLPSGYLKRRRIRGPVATDNVVYAAPIDAYNNKRMDILRLRDLQIYAVVGYFKFKDITKAVLPKHKPGDFDGVSAVAEADFNNDGIMDVYIARCARGDLSYRARIRGLDISDILLFGTRSGRYERAPVWSGVPRNTHTRGLTVGDFNNDGSVDVVLSVWSGRDILLINRGNGNFRRIAAPWFKKGNAFGDSATAVDYDQDGRLDIVLSEGSWSGYGKGFFRIMKNILPSKFRSANGKMSQRNYLLVRVGSSKSKRASSLHALVKITAGNLKLVRRVGSPSVAVSISYIETVHFGIGWRRIVDFVQVIWTDGSRMSRLNVKANSILKLGSF